MEQVIKAVSRYGTKAITWVKSHPMQILDWIGHGSINWIVKKVKQAAGIK